MKFFLYIATITILLTACSTQVQLPDLTIQSVTFIQRDRLRAVTLTGERYEFSVSVLNAGEAPINVPFYVQVSRREEEYLGSNYSMLFEQNQKSKTISPGQSIELNLSGYIEGKHVRFELNPSLEDLDAWGERGIKMNKTRVEESNYSNNILEIQLP